jgi:hypothetical protein
MMYPQKNEGKPKIMFSIHTKYILTVSGEGLPRNWMILLGHRMLQYIGEEP